MIKIMRLNLREDKVISYVRLSILTYSFLLIFTYFIAYVAQIENVYDFKNYNNIFIFTITINFITLSIISALMYMRFLIKENRVRVKKGETIKGEKVTLTKIMFVFLFSTLSLFICSVITSTFFYLSESISPIVNDTLYLGLLRNAFETIIVYALTIGGVGIISMRVGLMVKSTVGVIISAFILSGIIGNAVIDGHGNIALINGVIIIVTVGIIFELMYKSNGK